ncbi:DUF2856 family protein [Escherichia coli]|nr:DUF2856 family protein [Escherichia coli]MCV8516255.1 DUF2856 family protein [Escherichia coli]MCV8684338.1 DUF2856 family protein [Escherichia coli]MCV8809942.1 DUF2856 family protein [Escherichia coli]MCV8968738.1 DUF2856 family protein [Escherichia coli]
MKTITYLSDIGCLEIQGASLLPQETKDEKEFRHCIWLAEKEERERIYQTSIRPFRKATYTHFPEYIDPRLRNYRSRYGAISND